jgi:hypothetical protein
MKYSNKWFSLIEVIVATSILTIAVFWVFKLIAENSKILTNSNNFMQANFLLQPTKECLNKIWNDIWINVLGSMLSPVYLNLWFTWTDCSTWNNTTLLILDNIEYQIYAEINNKWSDFIDWNIIIDSNVAWKVKLNYLQK